MTNALILLTLAENVKYRDRLRAQFPQVKVDMVDHFTKVDPFIAETDVLITFPSMVRDEVLRRAPRLKWVQALGTGLDGLIDLPSLRPEVTLTSVRGIHGAPLSESAFCSMLALARRLPRAIRSQDQHKWDRWPASLLAGKTVGILGVGAIALELAPRCKAFGMRVVGISGAADRTPPGFDEMRRRDDLAHAVADLDYLVLLCPLTPETKYIVDAPILAAMKPTSHLINIARGGVVKESDLIVALKEGRIAGAALDALEQEPLPPNDPLWSAGNVIITAHLAGYNDEYIDGALPIIAHNMTCFLAGKLGDMIHVVER